MGTINRNSLGSGVFPARCDPSGSREPIPRDAWPSPGRSSLHAAEGLGEEIHLGLDPGQRAFLDP